MIGYVRAAPGFVLRSTVSALIAWLFLQGVVVGVGEVLGAPINPSASLLWVLGVGGILVMVDARLRRYRLFLANFGISRLQIWLPGWLVLVSAELLFRLGLLLR
jgi:hypothetical protein